MYIYDTRTESHKTLPINGWFFPCIVCYTITGQTKNKRIWKDTLLPIKYKIPYCSRCKKYNKKIDNIDDNKIKFQD